MARNQNSQDQKGKMMRPIQGLFAAALLATLPLLSPQTAMAAPGQKEVIDRFVTYSSYASQFEELPQLVRSQIESALKGSAPSTEKRELSALLLESFAADHARNVMTQQLSLGYDNVRYVALVQKLETPLIRKMREMELAIHEPTATEELQEFVARLPENPLPPKREVLIRDLLKARGTVDNTLHTRATLNEVVHTLINSSSSSVSGRILQNDAIELSQAVSRTLRPSVEAEAFATAAYAYRNASDDDIKKYTDFHNSPAGLWFKQTQENGWLGALRNIGREIAWKMQQPDGGAQQATALEDELGL